MNLEAIRVTETLQEQRAIAAQVRNLYPDNPAKAQRRREWLDQSNAPSYTRHILIDHDKNDNNVIGSITTIHMPFVLNGRVIVGGLLSDFSLDEEYRKGFNALKLFDAAVTNPDPDFIYGTPNDNSEPLFKRGFAKFPFKKFVKVLDTKPYLNQKYGTPGYLAGFVVNTGLHVIDSFTKSVHFYSPCKLTFTKNDYMHNAMSYPAGLSGLVEPDIHKWRYTDYYQSIGYQYFNMEYNGTTAHIVYHVDEDRRAIVMEIIGQDNDLPFILDTFEKWHKRNKYAVAICFEFVGYYNLESALRLCGYKQRENNHNAYIYRKGHIDLSQQFGYNRINLLMRDGDYT